MYTLKDYLNFRGDLDFETSPVNEIDELVFASMGKADFTEVLREDESGTYSDVFNAYFDRHGKQEDKSLGLLESPVLMKTLHKIAQCRRYADVRVSHFVNIISTENTEQMSALTVLGPNGRIYVTFRGTDDTLVGWKENCELAVMETVPAQRDAAAYLQRVAAAYTGPIVVSGHSKGGNLAIYAAAQADEEIQARIEKIVSYDGPGFLKDFLEKTGYLEIRDRITTLVPTASIVGMLMNRAGEMDVIQCEKVGPSAHDIFLWGLTPDSFCRAENISERSLVFHQAINQTIDEMAIPERQELVDEIFEVLSYTGAANFSDFNDHTIIQAIKIAGRFNKAKEIKQFLVLLARLSIKGAVNNTVEKIGVI